MEGQGTDLKELETNVLLRDFEDSINTIREQRHKINNIAVELFGTSSPPEDKTEAEQAVGFFPRLKQLCGSLGSAVNELVGEVNQLSEQITK